MQLDSLMTCHLVNELNQQLIGAQIREIHQTDDRMFEIELFRVDAKPMHLLLCAYTPTYLCVLSHKRKNTNFIPSQHVHAETSGRKLYCLCDPDKHGPHCPY